MTQPKDSILRIGKTVLVATAGLLTVLSVISLAQQGQGHQRVTKLIEKYTAAVTVKDKSQPPTKDPKGTKPTKDDSKNKDKPKPKPKGKDKPKPKPKDKPKKPAKKVKSPQEQQIERICKRHAFSLAPPKKTFTGKLRGVLDNLAYFDADNKGCKVGQDYKGAKLKEIGPDWVIVVFQGKPRTLHVFGPGSAKSSPPGAPKPPPVARPGRPGGPRRTRGRPGMMRSRGFRMSPRMIEQFKSMPADRRKRALERMPAEIREKIEKAL